MSMKANNFRVGLFVILALGVLTVLVVMVIPIPTFLLDIFLSFSFGPFDLSVAVRIIMTAMCPIGTNRTCIVRLVTKASITRLAVGTTLSSATIFQARVIASLWPLRHRPF